MHEWSSNPTLINVSMFLQRKNCLANNLVHEVNGDAKV